MPGRVDSVKSAGCHWLIRQGAQLVRHGGDILEALGWGPPTPDVTNRATASPGAVALSDEEAQLWAVLEVYPQDIDTLGRRSALRVSDLPGLLLQLELRGLVRQLPGQLYERCTGD